MGLELRLMLKIAQGYSTTHSLSETDPNFSTGFSEARFRRQNGKFKKLLFVILVACNLDKGVKIGLHKVKGPLNCQGLAALIA